MKKLVYVLIFLAFFALGFLGGRKTGRPKVIDHEVIKRDTVLLFDTVRVDRPVYITERVVENIYVPVTDTVRLRDTTYMVLPRTQRVYSDSLYKAWVSGYQPALDSLDVYYKEYHITKTIIEKPKKWHVGLQGGYGISKDGLTPYIGVGLSYSLLSF